MAEDQSTAEYEVVVVGGGPAGMTAALYSTRLGHRTALVDRGGGRAAMMQDVHNLIGVREETSGNEFLSVGTDQLEEYGCDVRRDMIASCGREDEGVVLEGNAGTYRTEYVVLATGFNDVRPDPPLPRTGSGLHYCLHCDAHMFVDQPVYVMGTGESAAHVAGIMLNFTDEVDLLTRGEDPEGAKAGISIHFALRDFPRDPERIEEGGPVRSEAVPGIPDDLLEQAVDFHTYD
jgi:thioredoxin reductase (NADPH)